MKTICFYPQTPGRSSKLLKYANRLGLEIAGPESLSRASALMFWKYHAYHDPEDPVLLEGIEKAASRAIPIYNLGAVDVRKATIDRYQIKHLGPSALVDSERLFEGRGVAVEKGDGQCTKDGRIVTLPIGSAEAGKVYMKLIDTRRPAPPRLDIAQTIGPLPRVDIRIPIFDGRIPFVIRKWKDSVFKRGTWIGELLEDWSKELSADEAMQTVRLMKDIGIDYAEIDALRDSSGELYIIDINPTPGTMGGIWQPIDRKRWEDLYLSAFRDAFL